MHNIAGEKTGSLDWYLGWQREVGRPLRVLHLGNIANNAFNNARIQRLYGIDAFVIAYENYHIMSSPEWEEAAFRGDYRDQFFPDWTKVDLAGYERPRWFASGPLPLCCEVIASQVDGDPKKTDELFARLKARREAVCLQGYRGQATRLATRVRRKLSSELRSLKGSLSSDAQAGYIGKNPAWARLLKIWKSANVSRDTPVSARDFKSYAARLECCGLCFRNLMSCRLFNRRCVAVVGRSTICRL